MTSPAEKRRHRKKFAEILLSMSRPQIVPKIKYTPLLVAEILRGGAIRPPPHDNIG